MNKKNNQPFTIILAIIACLLTIINIRLYISKYQKEIIGNEVNNQVTSVTKKTDEQKKAELIEELKTMNERDRMERYFGEYIDYIESGEYEKAYALLYPEFKQNYFKTLDDFKKYVSEKYPDIIIVDYDNIERQGEYYVLFINIPKANGTSETISQNIVLYEKDYAEYYISFSM